MRPDIYIKDFSYCLPEDRIAKYPLPERDASKLLIYRDGIAEEKVFRDLPAYLPEDSLMVFNETRVVPARMRFQKATGAHIEIFCLEPVYPAEYNLAFAETARNRWKCIIGNAKRWKEGEKLSLFNPESNPEINNMGIEAALLGREGQTGIVEFCWKDSSPFSRVLEICGNIPIPPYLNRKTESIDEERYQTLYAKMRGSVAAPTAGLHFTDEVMSGISARGIDMEKLCLHVGAGTFLPVKTSNVAEHPMHREPFSVSLSLLKKLRETEKKVIAVGTTSVRTLESLYYAGAGCIEKGMPSDIGQWTPYEADYKYSTQEALDALILYLEEKGLESLSLGTSIIITPGFKFRMIDTLITNFHQPESTLLLLVSAFLGGEWKRVYDFAMSHDFRFLSYGDSSLLFRKG